MTDQVQALSNKINKIRSQSEVSIFDMRRLNLLLRLRKQIAENKENIFLSQKQLDKTLKMIEEYEKLSSK